MPYETRELVAKINGDTSGLDKALSKSTSNLSKTATSINKFANVAAGALLAVGTAAVGFGVSSVKAFEESQNALAQTDAVIKSTGGAAGVTRDEVLKLATAFESNSRYADETVQSAENMLLTFTNIGKDVFPQTTQAVLDMSTAMGQDLQQTAIQVGKALQDPVLGATALQRVGVRLTDTQKALIKTMVDAGNTMGAQKIILGELTREFGGSAAAAGDTFAGKIDKLKNAFNNMQETIGGAIADALMPLVTWFQSNQDKIAALVKVVIDNAIPALAGLATAFGVAKAAAIAMDIALNANPISLIIDAIVLLVGWLVYLQVKFNWVGKAVEYVQEKIKPLTDWFVKNLLPIIKQVVAWVGGQFKDAWDSLVKSVNDIIKQFKDAGINIDMAKVALYAVVAVVTLAAAPIVLLISLIVGISLAVLKLIAFMASLNDGFLHFTADAVRNFMNFSQQVANIINGIIAYFQNFPYNFGQTVGQVIGMAIKFGEQLQKWAASAIPNVINTVIAFFTELPSATSTVFSSILTNISNWFINLNTTVGKFMYGFIQGFVQGFQSLPQKIYDIGVNIINGLINGIKDTTNNVNKTISSFVSGLVDGIKKQLGIHSPSTVFAEIGKNIGAGLTNGIDSHVSKAAQSAKSLADSITNGFQTSLGTPTVTLTGTSNISTPPQISGANVAATSPTSVLNSQSPSNVTLSVNVGMYAGMPVEKREIALELYRELVRAARSQGVSLPMIGVGSVQ